MVSYCSTHISGNIRKGDTSRKYRNATPHFFTERLEVSCLLSAQWEHEWEYNDIMWDLMWVPRWIVNFQSHTHTWYKPQPYMYNTHCCYSSFYILFTHLELRIYINICHISYNICINYSIEVPKMGTQVIQSVNYSIELKPGFGDSPFFINRPSGNNRG